MSMTKEEHVEDKQYSLSSILLIWIAASLPLAVLGWVIAPVFGPDFQIDPVGAAGFRIGAMAVGLVWLVVLSLLIVYHEEGDIRWPTVKQRLWLYKPQDPKTGEARSGLWFWLIPIIILLGLTDIVLGPVLSDVWVSILPFFAEPRGFAMGSLLELPEVKAQMVGAWWFLWLMLFMGFFNSVGEEFLFRGVLLPRMKGQFGKWDWVANGVLNGAFHWHQPWGILGNIVAATFFFALPTKIFRSTWVPIIAHMAQTVFFGLIILGFILGVV